MVRGFKAAVHQAILLAAWQFVGTMAAGESVQRDQLRMASTEEGEAIVQAAWELRRGLIPKPDCSHFVNAVYSQAGFDYEYANSKEIFDGIDSFARVPTPQAGDLIVWRGHMGIVIDPEEHSFYSSLLSGFAISDYRSDYWSGHGSPRFYRYLVDQTHEARLKAHLRGNGPTPVSDKPTQSTKPVVLSNLDPNNAINLAASSARQHPAADITETVANDTEVSDAVFVSRSAKPSKEELLAVITRNADVAGEHLLRESTLRSSDVSVAERLTVRELTIHDKSGWAELEIKQAATIQSGKVDLNKATLHPRLMLRRDPQGWIVLLPRDRIYLQRDLAVKVLVNHLARLPDTSGTSRDVFNIVHALDTLLAPMNRPRVEAGMEFSGNN